jgi:PKD repeat protein
MEPTTIDMIYLHENNLSEVLGVTNLTVGNYTKLWIVIDDATGVLKETDEEITFDVPSGDLKVQQSFEIKEGNTTIDVELDLDRSVLYVPQGGVYKLTPQLGKMTIDHEGDEDDDEDEEEFEADAGDEYEGIVNETIEFEGKAEGGVEPYNWSWDFGDGNTSTEQNPEHAYNATGNYTAILTVTDNEGKEATDTATVTIDEESED